MLTADAPGCAGVVEEKGSCGEAPASRCRKVVAELVAECGLPQTPGAPQAHGPPLLEELGEAQLQRLAAHKVVHARPQGPVRQGIGQHEHRRRPPHRARGAAGHRSRLAQEHKLVGQAVHRGVGAPAHGGPGDLVAGQERPVDAEGLVERRTEEVSGPVQELHGATDGPPQPAEASELTRKGLRAAGEEDQQLHAVPGARCRKVRRRHHVGAAPGLLENQELGAAQRQAVRGDVQNAGAGPGEEHLAEALHRGHADLGEDALGCVQRLQVRPDVERPELLPGVQGRGVQEAHQHVGGCRVPLPEGLVRDLAGGGVVRSLDGRCWPLEVLPEQLLDHLLLRGDYDPVVRLLPLLPLRLAADGFEAGVIEDGRRCGNLGRLLLLITAFDPDHV
mmetsp:Transcript_76026/g.226601  ORF Transcript_76026/g.226601 Transcript_76026/m.226601 type:complete len:391 (+) Transcript_76026:818-1990(+)